MNRIQLLAVGLVLAGGCMGVHPEGWGPVKDGVVVENTDFMGWTNSWKISNQACELIVVPAINHVMSFSLKGGSNVFWVAPDVNGRVVQERGEKWHNFGGDKVWPTDEALWRHYTGRRWPPSYAFDGGQATAEPILNGVRMTSQEDPDFGAVCVREFIMDPVNPQVYIHQYFEKKKGAVVDMTFWTVSQIRRPTFCLLPLGKVEGGLRYRKLAALLPTAFESHASVLSLKIDEDVCQKVGVVPDPAFRSGWVAALFKEDRTLFLQSTELDAGATYPDKGCHAEVFTSTREFGFYCELELLSPMVALSAGQRYEHDVVWQLLSLNPEELSDPQRAGDKAARAHSLALKRLNGKKP